MNNVEKVRYDGSTGELGNNKILGNKISVGKVGNMERISNIGNVGTW